MFLQVPFPQGWRSHSSMSGGGTGTGFVSQRAFCGLPPRTQGPERSRSRNPLCPTRATHPPPDPTHAHGEVAGGLEPIEAEAEVAPFRVHAVAVAADIGNLLALVPASKGGDGTESEQS